MQLVCQVITLRNLMLTLYFLLDEPRDKIKESDTRTNERDNLGPSRIDQCCVDRHLPMAT